VQRRVAWFGYFNSLAQVLLKITCPGVPDFYQGTELWDLSLVDPDNRRPVDYDRRREILGSLKDWVGRLGEDLLPLTRELLGSLADGRIKLYLTWRALSYRQEHAPLFAEGAYLPLEMVGTQKDHVCAFARVADAEAVIVVPRLLLGLTGNGPGREEPPMGPAVWQDTWLVLPAGLAGDRRYRHLFTGETLTTQEKDGRPGLPLAQVLGNFPVALLARLAD
jgi:(1->4)-alpha-D-glucan 1-alpha-D-glucosylmutase